MTKLKARVRRNLSRVTVALLSLPGLALAQQIAIGGYALPTLNSLLIGITTGPDGALWFTDYDGNKTGRIKRDAGARNRPGERLLHEAGHRLIYGWVAVQANELLALPAPPPGP